MAGKEFGRREFLKLGTTVILGAVLAACTPEGQAQETRPAITQTIDGLDVPGESEEAIVETITNTATDTPELTTTPENTPTPEATSTPEATATPEASEMHEYAIRRAKEVGIDLENLDNSNNLWLTEIQGLESLQEAFETSFSDDRIFKTMIVVGLDSLNSQARYDQAPTTTDNKKIMSWIEAVYKDTNGQYQMVLLPTHIWYLEKELMWNKSAIFGRPQYATDINSKHMFNHLINNFPHYNPDYRFAAACVGNQATQNYYIGPGAFISFDSDYPTSTAGGAGTLEEPNFSEEQMLDFQNTGNAEFFPYFMIDPKTGIKQPIIYPFINYGTLVKLDNYQEQAFVEEYVNWFTDITLWGNPDGPPWPRHWQPLP
jgi:hypothetical protein